MPTNVQSSTRLQATSRTKASSAKTPTTRANAHLSAPTLQDILEMPANSVAYAEDYHHQHRHDDDNNSSSPSSTSSAADSRHSSRRLSNELNHPSMSALSILLYTSSHSRLLNSSSSSFSSSTTAGNRSNAPRVKAEMVERESRHRGLRQKWFKDRYVPSFLQ